MAKLLQSIGNYAIINSILNSFFMNKRKLKTGSFRTLTDQQLKM